uniref:Putative ovule protein n=1 Tax=Solanum chacoense TaxID=4108 RepID=A0A0V0IG12_SOLCH
MLTGECQIFKSSAYLEDPHGCGSILGEPEQHNMEKNMEKGGHWLEYPNTEMVQLTLTGVSKSSTQLCLFHRKGTY